MNDLTVSFGVGDLAVITDRRVLDWPAFAKWLTETPPELPDKSARGWYIPAEFEDSRRHSDSFVARHAITFDFDHVTIDTWGQALDAWDGLAMAFYTTYSHRPEAPRFRVVVPLSRPAGYDEFQAVARKVAADVGIELIARESFVPCQLMFAPARCLGGLFHSVVTEGDALDVDAVLGEYADWTDVRSWPHRREGDAVHASGERVNPLEKPGIIGEFNRAFSISQAIERFELPYRRVR